jgi:hypothetical protein
MALFDKWAADIFFHSLRLKRKGPTKYEGKAVLIMDCFGAHSTPAFEEECKKENVVVKFLVPHTSDRCQPLDMLVFSNLKSHYARKRVATYDSQQTNRIVKMMRAWWAAIAPDIIVSSFRDVGIIPFLPLGYSQVYCRVDLNLSLKLKGLVSPGTLSSNISRKPLNVKFTRIKVGHLPSDFYSESED